MSPLDRLYTECARNVCAVLAMDEDGEHEVSDLVARAVAHRQRTFSAWYPLDEAEARRQVGARVAEWLRGRAAA
jgi:hypothetical protein